MERCPSEHEVKHLGLHISEGHIRPHPPFDFNKSQEFLAGFAP
ncbi:MAG: hypothetical protein QOH93_1091, partial [Chloroflexia bacterium]|nr:hypothetical protein [Chloroflexia bacterium]